MIELRTILKSALAVSAVALAPAMASAATVTEMSTNNAVPYSLDSANDLYRWDTQDEFAGSNAGETYFFAFSASDLPQGTNTSMTVNRTGDFENLQVVWSSDMVIDGGDTALTFTDLGNLSVADFSFAIPASPYYLITTYDSVSNGGNLDYAVSAVPVPAAGFLLLTAIGGIAATRRRRKAA